MPLEFYVRDVCDAVTLETSCYVKPTCHLNWNLVTRSQRPFNWCSMLCRNSRHSVVCCFWDQSYRVASEVVLGLCMSLEISCEHRLKEFTRGGSSCEEQENTVQLVVKWKELHTLSQFEYWRRCKRFVVDKAVGFGHWYCIVLLGEEVRAWSKCLQVGLTIRAQASRTRVCFRTL